MKLVFRTQEERQAWRMAGIGSSDAPIIMGASPWSSIADLILIKTGQKESEPPNWAMRRGLFLEKTARKAYEAETGIPMPPENEVYPKNPILRASFDGINRDAKRALEIKCPGRTDHFLARKGQIPEKYIWQLVHLMLVCGLPHIDYYSFHPDFGGGMTIPFKRNSRLEKTLIQKETEFWREIEKTKETLMKTKSHSAADIHAILEKVKELRSLGVTSLSMEGFSFGPGATQIDGDAYQHLPEQEPGAPRRDPFRVRRNDEPRRSRPRPRLRYVHKCADCGSTDLEGWMQFCSRCYISHTEDRNDRR